MHVCDFTTAQISSKYVHKQYIDHSENEIEFNQFENRDWPYGGTHAQGTGGSSPTHGELLEVADHSLCRKMYAVQSLECPPGSRRSEEEEDVGSHQEELSSCKDAPQKLHPHTRADVTDVDGGFGGLLSQLSVRAEDGMGSTWMQLDRRKVSYGHKATGR